MNIKPTHFFGWTIDEEDNTKIYIERLYIIDPNSKYDATSITAGSYLYLLTRQDANHAAANCLCVYKIDSINSFSSSYISGVSLTRENAIRDINKPLLIRDPGTRKYYGEVLAGSPDDKHNAFICSAENGVADIPPYDTFQVLPLLIESARTYNISIIASNSGSGGASSEELKELKTQVYQLQHTKHYTQIVNINELTEDVEAEDGKKYAVKLDYYPLSDVNLEINGIIYNENDDNDFIVERDKENQTATIYFDAEQDDFSITDLQELSDDVRLKYMALVIEDKE